MTQDVYPLKAKVRSFLYLLVLSLLVWLALTATFELQEMLIGIGVCVALSALLNSYYLRLGLPPLNIKRLAFFLIYLVVVGWEIVKANFDVAYRVVHPKMPIKPGVVVIKTRLKSDIAKMILANSITLTPGTFTLDVGGDRLLIHWINVKTEKTDEATKLIAKRFEKYLRVVFQ